MRDYIKLAHEIFRELCVIPAPSNLEDKRVEYCVNKLKTLGITNVVVDQAKNVLIEFPCENSNEWVVFEAHTDVVFPDLTPLPFREDEQNYYCPGAGDDTVCVSILISAILKIKEKGLKPTKNVLFVLNSCEEGLGNLKGTREIMKKYGDKVTEFYTLDGKYNAVVDLSVGSHRYDVTVETIGGHSFGAFGNPSAMHLLAKVITEIYKIQLPQKGKTTYNVGTVNAGTSVNTIPQKAQMLCEYRSDVNDNLAYMKEKFFTIFKGIEKDAKVTVELVGERPSMGNVDMEKQKELTKKVVEVQAKHTGLEIEVRSGSTDCNIPHSLGIPSVCVGVYEGGGAHTREEWVAKSSVEKGLAIAYELIENYFN